VTSEQFPCQAVCSRHWKSPETGPYWGTASRDADTAVFPDLHVARSACPLTCGPGTESPTGVCYRTGGSCRPPLRLLFTDSRPFNLSPGSGTLLNQAYPAVAPPRRRPRRRRPRAVHTPRLADDRRGSADGDCAPHFGAGAGLPHAAGSPRRGADLRLAKAHWRSRDKSTTQRESRKSSRHPEPLSTESAIAFGLKTAQLIE